VDATSPGELYPDRSLLSPEHNLRFLKRCIQAFREVNFADQKTGRIYLRVRNGVPVLGNMLESPVLSMAVASGTPTAIDHPLYVEGKTLGQSQANRGQTGS